MKKGVGSVWNQGSWHWEEKNYNKWAQERLKAFLETAKVTEQGFLVEINKCITLEGEVKRIETSVGVCEYKEAKENIHL